MLLAGASEPAQAVVLETFADAGEKIHHVRNGKNCKAWLIAKVRERLLKNADAPTSGTDLNAQTSELAGRFCRIPEPGRSALALLYLDQFSPREIAQILEMSPEELPDAVDSARTLLRQMEAARRTPSPTGQPEP